MSGKSLKADTKLLKVLVVSPDEELKLRLTKIFKGKNIQIIWRKRIDRLLDNFGKNNPDVLLLDISRYSSAKKPIIENIKKISIRYPSVQVLLLIKPKEIRIAGTALKAGSFHYARIPTSDEELALLIEVALEQKAQSVQTQLRTEADRRVRFGEIIGSSPSMQEVYNSIDQATQSDVPVLLLGETGTGKDLVAQAIHRLSPRNTKPYIAANLGALPIELVASELFGHVKGAFTGAVDTRKGVFEQAGEGTAFLDEIDSVDNKVQVSLLRLLEDKKFNRLGGRRAMRNRARIIAASNTKLEELTQQGNFRKDLFYRLDVFRINLPPLRDRIQDLPLLINDFIDRYNRLQNKRITRISNDCMQILSAFNWPGNVRELKNIIQRAVLICRGTEITAKHLPKRFTKHPISENKYKKQNKELSLNIKIGTPLSDVEKMMVVSALDKSGNNRKKAAELLGISRRALYNKLKKFGVK